MAQSEVTIPLFWHEQETWSVAPKLWWVKLQMYCRIKLNLDVQALDKELDDCSSDAARTTHENSKLSDYFAIKSVLYLHLATRATFEMVRKHPDKDLHDIEYWVMWNTFTECFSPK